MNIGLLILGIIILIVVFLGAGAYIASKALVGTDSDGRLKGQYLGTEVNGDWKQRYTEDGWLARGNGVYWLDEENFYFLRFLTDTPLIIARADITSIETGTKHSGRWAYGAVIVKIVWSRDGQNLSSGFTAGNTPASAEMLRKTLDDWTKPIVALRGCG